MKKEFLAKRMTDMEMELVAAGRLFVYYAEDRGRYHIVTSTLALSREEVFAYWNNPVKGMQQIVDNQLKKGNINIQLNMHRYEGVDKHYAESVMVPRFNAAEGGCEYHKVA